MMEGIVDLFDKPNKKKEFLEDGSVVINLNSNSKYRITVNNNIIRVEQSGFLNRMNRGEVDEKIYNLDNVIGTYLKEPGLQTGYFVIQTPGKAGISGSIYKAVKDEDSILFTQLESKLIHELNEYIENYLSNRQTPFIDQKPETKIQTEFTSNNPEPTIEAPRTKEQKKERKGCLFYLKIIGAVFLGLILLGALFSCFGIGGDNSEDQTAETETETSQEAPQETQQTEQQAGTNPDAEKYIRLANTYFAENLAYVQGFNETTDTNNFEDNLESLMTLISDLEQRVQNDLNQIPEDTTDPGLQLARQALEIDDNLCMATYATLATGDTSGTEMMNQYIQQYNDLKPQLDQYLNIEQ